MNQIVELFQSFFVQWLVVITILLGVAFLLQCLVKNHLLKQRIGELGIACVLLWTLLAIVPMPRWNLRFGSDNGSNNKLVAQQPVEQLPGQDESYDTATEQYSDSQPGNDFRNNESPLPDSSLELTLPAGTSQFDSESKRGAAQGLTGTPTDTPNSRSTAPQSTAPQSTVTWESKDKKALAVVGYLLGSLLIAFWIGIGYVVLAIIWLKGRSANQQVHAIFESLIPQTGRSPALRIGNSERTFIFGLLRPKIVLSNNVQDHGSREQIVSLLLHELAHCQQRDVWGRALFNLAMPLLYFHPLYWTCRRKSDLSAEVIADHVATQRVDLKTYVQSLVDVCRQVTMRKDWIASCSYRGVASFFTKRMKAVLRTNAYSISLSGRAQTACGLFTIAVALSTAAVVGHSGQEPQRLEAVRNSLAGRKSSLELAANRLPANTDVYISLNGPSIQRWSAVHAQLLSYGDASGRLTDVQVAKTEVTRMLDAVAISRNDMLELSNGQVVIASRSADTGKPSTAMIVESVGDSIRIETLAGQIKESISDSSLDVATINRNPCFVISNRERAVYVMSDGDHLLLTDNRELLQDLFSTEGRLADDPVFMSARTNVTRDTAFSDVDIFGFVRPEEFASRLNDQWPDDTNPSAIVQGMRFYLKTRFGNLHKPSTDSFAFVVREQEDRLTMTGWLGTRNDDAGQLEFLNAIQPEQWVAKGPSGLKKRTVVNINWPELLEFIEPIVDQSSGTTGSFSRSLDSLRLDPQGPRVDVAGFADRLGSAATFSWQHVDGTTPAEWMLEIPVARDAEVCREELDRLLRADCDLHETPDGKGPEFWVLRPVDSSAKAEAEAKQTAEFAEFGAIVDEKSEPEKEMEYPRRSIGIVNDQLVIASSPEMLLGMHEPVVPGRGLHSTTDYQHVVERMVQLRSAGSTQNPIHGFWFERLPQGLLGRVLQREQGGWRIHSVLQPRGDR